MMQDYYFVCWFVVTEYVASFNVQKNIILEILYIIVGPLCRPLSNA